MKVLQLCNKPPYPPVDGGTLAMHSITQGLLDAGCEVKVLTVATDKHPLGQLTEEYLAATRAEGVYVDLRVKALPAAVTALCGESYHVKRYISVDFAKRLREVLEAERFDVVHVESIFLTPYVPLIRRHSDAKVILRAHNVEYLIWRRMALGERNPLKRSYLKHLALTLRAYELEHVNDYDGVVCITRNDADTFRSNGCRRPIEVIPFGVEIQNTPSNQNTTNETEGLSLFHIGAMDWEPNRESVEWLLKEVWPVVHGRLPQARLYLAGRKMPQRLMDAPIDGVTVEGEVPDARRFMADKQINVVPLLNGSGIRVKIIEAMSMGKVVISTTVGAQGIDYTDGVDLLIADTPEDFARQIERCAADSAFHRSVGEAARKLITEQYDARRLGQRLVEYYNKRLDRE